MRKNTTGFIFLLLGISTSPVYGQSYKEQAAAERHAVFKTEANVNKPKELPPPPLEKLKVPAGFTLSRIGENLGNLRMMAMSDQGRMYVSRRSESDILLLKTDAKGNLTGETSRILSHPSLHGITFHKGKVYLATIHEILVADVLADGTFGPRKTIIRGLPDAGQHHTRTVRVGPDEKLYISVGSTCNECSEPNPENAAMLRASLDGKTRTIFASGLRDTIGWDWQPGTGLLWGMDHGIDWMGDEMPEELNHLEGGKFYGWPYMFGDNEVNRRNDAAGGLKKSEYRNIATPMVMGYKGHAAPMQMAFYNATQFPKDFEGDAFVAMHGSWNRANPSGYEVIRIHFEKGKPVKMEPFVTGFVTSEGESGRPCGLIIDKNGSLVFTDDRNGTLYTVRYTGEAKDTAAVQRIPPDQMLKQTQSQLNDRLAKDRPETLTKTSFKLSSPAFLNKAAIPLEYSAYADDASVPLEWSEAPAGTQSFVLMVEDPDVTESPKPFLHWLAWNIPATAKSLRRGMPSDPRLELPEGMRQGPNFAGTMGYKGPRPPEEKKAHNYHFMLFAVDKALELELGADREKVLQAMKGHVLGKAELVGRFQKPANPPKP